MRELGLGLGLTQRGGGPSFPNTAVYFPNGVRYKANAQDGPTPIVPSGNLGTMSFGMWIRVDSYLAPQYATFVGFLKSTNPGEFDSYWWIGRDHTASGGNRGVAMALGSLGAHTTTMLPALGTSAPPGITQP